MGWKNWPYWVKGGIIGIILSFFPLYFLSTTVLCADPLPGVDLSNPIFGCKSELERLFINLGLSIFVKSIFFVGIFFLIGVVIGLIIGKTLKRGNKNDI